MIRDNELVTLLSDVPHCDRYLLIDLLLERK